ncbi:hypothetical protein ANCDUO_07872 [Ancylostoma duodenale]|uniref:Amino acid transporter transmembrane domain-containing protein n=1 Tax=Ancylostoma duodenale TaxID=51022 RepID=A0A0C2GS33_9BILA|nr:hypothetical protein ANCDUO_07872 [Ancylostoma duodenale]
MVTTVVAVCSILIGIGIDFGTCYPEVGYPEQTPGSMILSLVVVMLYMPLSVAGYVVYGAALESSVIYSVQTSTLQLAANLMIAVHCIMTLVIVINPLNQEVEHYLKVSHSGFILSRCILWQMPRG